MREFWKAVWFDARRFLVLWLIAVAFGFAMGKVYTWDSTIADCRVMGVFRIANTAFQCKILMP